MKYSLGQASLNVWYQWNDRKIDWGHSTFILFLLYFLLLFLLYEHIQCKESIVVLRKNLTLWFLHMCTLWGLLTSFKLFLRWWLVCIYECMWLCTTVFKRYVRLNLNLVFILQVIVKQTLLIFVNAEIIVFYLFIYLFLFLNSSTEKNSYT